MSRALATSSLRGQLDVPGRGPDVCGRWPDRLDETLRRSVDIGSRADVPTRCPPWTQALASIALLRGGKLPHSGPVRAPDQPSPLPSRPNTIRSVGEVPVRHWAWSAGRTARGRCATTLSVCRVKMSEPMLGSRFPGPVNPEGLESFRTRNLRHGVDHRQSCATEHAHAFTVGTTGASSALSVSVVASGGRCGSFHSCCIGWGSGDFIAPGR